MLNADGWMDKGMDGWRDKGREGGMDKGIDGWILAVRITLENI